MLTHLLFSIAALIIMLIFMITYFSYRKNTNSVRGKVYQYMIYFTLAFTLIEIIEGFTYAYRLASIYSLMWKLHSVLIIIIIANIYYYFLISVETQISSFEDLVWNNKKALSINNIFTIVFVVAIVFSIIFVKPYTMRPTMFYFYTKQSITFLLFLYMVYILYNLYIVYLKNKKDNFERNDYIILIGTFILFIIALLFERAYRGISIYSTLFTLVLILLYYFKENEDLIVIEELQKEQLDLSNNNNSKTNYLYGLVNDLDYPLSNLNEINKELINNKNITSEELINDINCLNYISNDFVRVLDNKFNKNSSTYRINELVKNIESIVEPSIKQKAIKLSCEIDPNIPTVLIGDYSNVHRIIMNLLINAIESTEIGKIVLNINGEKQKDIEVLNIRVSDTGKGIKEEDYASLFSGNGESSDKKSDLRLVKQYIEELNGKLSFESHYGSGSIFYVSFSQKIFDETPISQNPVKKDNIVIKNCNNKKVLIVDDSDYSSKKLYSILTKHNLLVNCIKKGNDAINMIKLGEEYDLVIVNDNIKDTSFIDVGSTLKYLGKTIKVPVLVALILDDSKPNLGDSFDEFVLKPLNVKKINGIINKISE